MKAASRQVGEHQVPRTWTPHVPFNHSSRLKDFTPSRREIPRIAPARANNPQELDNVKCAQDEENSELFTFLFESSALQFLFIFHS